MRLPRLLIVLLGLLFLGGCQNKLMVGGRVPPKLYKTVVSLSPGATENIIGFARKRLIGRTASCDKPPGVEKTEVVMKGTKPDYERIRALHPDVIVYDSDLFSPNDLQMIKDLGFDTLDVSGHTLEDFNTSLYRIGRFTATESVMSGYVDKIHRASVEAQAVDPHLKVAVVLPGPGGQDMIEGKGSFVADVLKACGAEPVSPEGDKFMMLNAESFVQQNPDLIIVSADDKKSVEEVARDPRFASINAVKNGNVVGFKSEMVVRKGAQVDKFIEQISAQMVRAKR